jgi:hypothetical protein
VGMPLLVQDPEFGVEKYVSIFFCLECKTAWLLNEGDIYLSV